MASSLKRDTITNFAWKFSEQVLSQGVAIVVSIVLARILLPKDYGVVTIVLIFIAICDVFISQGFASTLIQRKEIDQKDLSSMFYASLGVSSILYLLLFFSAPYIQIFFGSEYKDLSSILRVMGLQIPVSAYKAIQQAIVSRQLMFKKFFFATLGGKIVSGVVGILMAIGGFGAWALVGQSLSCIIVDTLILSLIVAWHPLFYFSWKRVKPLLLFGSSLVMAGLIDTLYNKLRSFVIGYKYTPNDIAFYEKGDQFPALLMGTINASLNTVLFPVLSKMQNSASELLLSCRRSVKISTFIMFPIMAALAIVSEDLICFLLTDKWQPCAIYAQIFCAVYSFHPIYSINLQAIKAVGRGKTYLGVELWKKINGIVCLLIGMNYGVIGIALSLLASTFVNFFINGVAANKVLNYSIKMQLQDIGKNLLSIVVTLLVVILIPKSGNHIIDWLVFGFLTFIIYIVISFVIKNDNLMYVINTIKDVFNRTHKE